MATPKMMQELMASYLKTDLISHSRRVCNLYKRMIRDQDWKHYDHMDAKLNVLKIRAEFDKNKDIKDTRKAKLLLAKAEQEFIKNMDLFYKSGQELLPFSKDGIAYGRNEEYPDYIMDTYHPLEKACYPKYFARREELKREYLALWKKKMLKSTVKEPHNADGH